MYFYSVLCLAKNILISHSCASIKVALEHTPPVRLTSVLIQITIWHLNCCYVSNNHAFNERTRKLFSIIFSQISTQFLKQCHRTVPVTKLRHNRHFFAIVEWSVSHAESLYCKQLLYCVFFLLAAPYSSAPKRAGPNLSHSRQIPSRTLV